MITSAMRKPKRPSSRKKSPAPERRVVESYDPPRARPFRPRDEARGRVDSPGSRPIRPEREPRTRSEARGRVDSPGSRPIRPEREPRTRSEALRRSGAPHKYRYLLLHKPLDVLCQFTDVGGRPTLADFVPVPGVYPVGRLDADSEGLVLLTDDGALQFRLADPRFKQPKTYLVQVDGAVSEDAAARLRAGVVVGGELLRAVGARVLDEAPDLPPRARPIRVRASIPSSWMEIVLVEGKNRQVRRMTAAVGFPTLRLVRVAIGPLRLEGLAAGEWRELRSQEVAGL